MPKLYDEPSADSIPHHLRIVFLSNSNYFKLTFDTLWLASLKIGWDLYAKIRGVHVQLPLQRMVITTAKIEREDSLMRSNVRTECGRIIFTYDSIFVIIRIAVSFLRQLYLMLVAAASARDSDSMASIARRIKA